MLRIDTSDKLTLDSESFDNFITLYKFWQ